MLPVKTSVNTYKYLGTEIGALGACNSPVGFLKQTLTNISKAPLQPQQRLFILREYLIPKVKHQLTPSDFYKKSLKHLQFFIRSSVKAWLKMNISCVLATKN